jgi:predicted N-acetyltransferase YhbS
MPRGNTEHPIIRPAAPDDAAELAALRYEFRAAERPATEARAPFVARTTEWMRDRLAQGTAWRCFVAVRGGAIVGQVWITLVEKVPNPGGNEPERHAYLTNLYVRPDARGGTGSALLEAALASCRGQRVDTVILWPSEQSRTLYARYGFDVSRAVMALPLATDAARPGAPRPGA